MMAAADFQMNANLHGAFKRELTRLTSALDSIDLADAGAVAGYQRRFRFFAETLHTHHVGEDRFVWPVAQARASPAEKAILHSMESEHESLAAALATAGEDVAGLGPGTDVDTVAAHITDLAAVLNGHCVHEERDAVPILAKYLSPDDMKELVAHARAAPDSDLVLPWVCDGAPADVMRSTWAEIPALPRLFLRPITTRKYRRFTAECGV